MCVCVCVFSFVVVVVVYFAYFKPCFKIIIIIIILLGETVRPFIILCTSPGTEHTVKEIPVPFYVPPPPWKGVKIKILCSNISFSKSLN